MADKKVKKSEIDDAWKMRVLHAAEMRMSEIGLDDFTTGWNLALILQALD